MVLPVKKKRIVVILLAIFSLALFCGAFYGRKSVSETAIRSYLVKSGFQDVQLSLDDIGFSQLKLNNVSVGTGGGSPALHSASDVRLEFSLWNMLSGRINALEIQKANLLFKKTEDGWILDGLVKNPSNKLEEEKAFVLPVSESQLASLPVGRLSIDDATFKFLGDNWSLELAFHLLWDQKLAPQLSLQSGGVSMKGNGFSIDTGALDAQATLKEGETAWSGLWTLKNIKISAANVSLSPLNGKGALSAKDNEIVIDGKLEGEDSLTQLDLRYTLPLAESEDAELKIFRASVPWNEGKLLAQDVVWSLGKPKPSTVPIRMEGVSLDTLLRQLTKDKATGTGKISGTLPLKIDVKGDVSVGEGTLSAEGPGIIHMAPETIPGDNLQITFVRDVLKDLNYTHLSIDVKNASDGMPTLLMRVEGHNPRISGGRPVHLNVRLTGDVLDFVRQSVLSLINPQKFLESHKHEIR